jgi:rare lipoprotein A
LVSTTKAILLSLGLVVAPIATQAQTTTDVTPITTVKANTPILKRLKAWKPKTPALVSHLLKTRFFSRGEASFYGVGDGFQGARTASGKRFDTYTHMCAHRTLPFGTIIHIFNPKTKLSTDCAIYDRGPYANGRILDMSYAVKRALGIAGGTATVELSLIR